MKKKFLAIIFALFLIIPIAPILSACGEERESYWLESEKKLTELIAKDEFNFTNTVKLDSYGITLDNIISRQAYPSYRELQTIYEPLAKLSLSYVMQNKLALKTNPIKKPDEEMKKRFSNLDKKIEVLFKEFFNLSEAKKTFINSYEKTTNYNDVIELNNLKLYKRAYASLINKLIDMAEAFEKVYTYAYKDIIYKENSNLANNEELYVTRLTINRMLRGIYRYSMAELDCEDIYNRGGFDVKILLDFINLHTDESTAQNRISNLIKWQRVMDSYNNELSMYYESLDKIDLKHLYLDLDGNFANFNKEKSINQVYHEKILDFNNKTLPLMLETLKGLF